MTMYRLVRLLLAVVAAGVALVALGLHLATFAVASPLLSMDVWAGMHIVVLAIAGVAFVTTDKKNDAFEHMGPFAQRACGAVVLFAFLNGAIAMYQLRGGGPDIKDGAFVLSSHGTVMRTITEAEYHLYQGRELRLFAGGWIAFSVVSAGLLSARRPKPDAAKGEDR